MARLVAPGGREKGDQRTLSGRGANIVELFPVLKFDFVVKSYVLSFVCICKYYCVFTLLC